MGLWLLTFISPCPQYIQYCILYYASNLMDGGTNQNDSIEGKDRGSRLL